jgi:hypothetical protein
MTGANVDSKDHYTANLTLFNCYVIPSPADSRRGIIQDTLYQMVEIMSRGGGVGMSLSALTPTLCLCQRRPWQIFRLGFLGWPIFLYYCAD